MDNADNRNFVQRFIQVGMTASIALFFSIVAFNNVTDFQSNFIFVQHVLSMDTTLQENALMWRALTTSMAHQWVYRLIILWESITAILCWIGCIVMVMNIMQSSDKYHRSKRVALLALFFGFLLYMVGFIVIGGEWFCMWQSPTWNGQMKAGMFINLIMFVMLFLSKA